jgi:hypothetical protein
MTTTYLSTAVLLQLDRAQTVINRHLVECVVCGTSKPCVERQSADAIFARYQRLPKRQPGMTRVGACSTASGGWFDA